MGSGELGWGSGGRKRNNILIIHVFKDSVGFFRLLSACFFLIVSLDSNPQQQQQQTCASDTILFLLFTFF